MKMNKNNLFLSSCVLAAGLLAGCSNENDGTDNGGSREIVLRATVSNLTTRTENPDTKIITGQEVGITITGQTEIVTNAKYTSRNDGSLAYLEGEAPKYPAEGKISVKAYHPYNVSTAFDFTVNPDQSVDQNYYNSDLLYTEKVDIANSNNVVALEFTHQLSKLTYVLTGPFIEPTQTVSVEEVETKVNYNNGVVTSLSGNKGTVKMNSKYGAIVVPQTGTAGNIRFKVEDGSDVFYSNTINTTEFEAGTSYKFTLNLSSNNELTVTTEEITGWNTSGENVEGEFVKVVKNFIINGDFDSYTQGDELTPLNANPSVGVWGLKLGGATYGGDISATIKEDGDTYTKYISLVTTATPGSWWATYIGQGTSDFEMAKYKLTFKARGTVASGDAKIIVGLAGGTKYDETGNTSGGSLADCFILTNDNANKYVHAFNSVKTTWNDYTIEFDFNKFVYGASGSSPVYDMTAECELFKANYFILFFHQNGATNFGTLDVSDVKLVKMD